MAITDAASSALRAPFAPSTWRETLHLVLGALVGVAAAGYLLLTAYALVFSLTVVGLVVLAVLVRGARLLGVVERARARALLGLEVDAPPRAPRGQVGLVGWVRAGLADVVGWRGLLYALLAVPAGLLQGALTVLLWGESLVLLTYPLWFRLQPYENGHYGGPFGWSGWSWHFDVWPGPLVLSVIGLVGVLAAPWVVRALAALDRRRIAGLLGPSRLAERIHLLEQRRGQAVDQAASHLRRIERDLHDGAQARIVALAMELGQAREELEHGDEPRRAAVRVAAAHEEAKRALVELRDLARGIYPAVLTDLGLEGAVPMLIARCPVPVSTQLEVPQRPTAAVEATAYFCIGELLTNVAKHSGAHSALVRVWCQGSQLRVEVRDDGVGGAVARQGGGLAGLVDRVESVDGRMRISSPDGGPTVVSVELPCAS
jgi:signal transduction histidine kinase